MKLSRRKMFGAMAGAAAATQINETGAQYEKAQFMPDIQGTDKYNLANTTKTDPDYWKRRFSEWKKILDGDFSDYSHRFENHTRIKREMNISCLKSISDTAKHTFMERAENEARKKELIDQAKQEIDRIMGMPFSVTGILFK